MVSVQLVPKYLHMIEVMRVFHAANEKKQDKNNIKTSQQLETKTRHCSCLQHESKEDQNFVVIANPPGSSSIL